MPITLMSLPTENPHNIPVSVRDFLQTNHIAEGSYAAFRSAATGPGHYHLDAVSTNLAEISGVTSNILPGLIRSSLGNLPEYHQALNTYNAPLRGQLEQALNLEIQTRVTMAQEGLPAFFRGFSPGVAKGSVTVLTPSGPVSGPDSAVPVGSVTHPLIPPQTPARPQTLPPDGVAALFP